ncbi:hypothetical protein CFBP5507_06185 [Agrobacterium salinitolerans]|uniref:Uncharacterized protein n=1 Tax=Agrobacterium salinitolerans TaxID=1183413 RepID=A0A4Z1QY31_9HYPH|nr:hypothetical protein [Agrobacterium salinitolerans]UYZ08588.1 hypothetical protein CFBP5507_06185 [Agrobacterium salinitolerans]
MEHYAKPGDCPNRVKLAAMSVQEAADWVASATTHTTEVSRFAEFTTFFNLNRQDADNLHIAAVKRRVAAGGSNFW